jgi:uncharacterized membrane protein YhaH (DUF805 family)
MKPDRIDRLLHGLPSDQTVPRGLSARILEAVEQRAAKLERRQIFWAALRLSLGVTAVIYGFTAMVLNLLNSNLNSYMEVVAEDPSILFTVDGLRALMEQVPILSALIFFTGLVYSIRHLMMRGVRARKLSTVMAGLFVVVACGSFVGGIAVGATNSGQMSVEASSVLFNPVVTPSSDYQYSSSGEVTSVENVDSETVEVTILLPNGTKKTVDVPQSVLDKNSDRVIKEGDKIYILGKPGGFPGKQGNFKANFIHLGEE